MSASDPVKPQGMASFGNGIWSGNSQLWWTAGEKGATVTLEFSVPKAGNYEVYFAGTKAIDYGIHSFAFNKDDSLGAPQDFNQAAGVSHTGQVNLGKTKLNSGKNTLTIKCISTHPDSVKKYMFGLDFLRIASTQ
ncbi:MAG: hypothetical protein L7W40_12770 [Akkermansiaceae bacterium]|nr:hypothetical protein [Akkermansiaceae bacterium]